MTAAFVPAWPLPLILAASLAPACGSDPAAARREPPPQVTASVVAGYPQLEGSCRGPVAEPRQLVVTSTDFNTGAVGLVDLEARRVAADLAPASTDAAAFVDDGRVFVVNRFNFDWIDELEGEDLALVHQFAVTASTRSSSANPHALALEDGDASVAWVSLFGAPELQRWRFPELRGAAPTAEFALDLSTFADVDGIPELSLLIPCGDLLFVSAERLDRSSWQPTGPTLLIPVATGPAPQLFEFDDDHPGADAIELLGTGVGPWRLDPGDPRGQTVLLLNSGLERIDLAAGTSEWLIPATQLASRGYSRLQLSGFDLDAEGRVWIAAASEDFAEFRLLRAELEPQLEIAEVVTGLASVTGALEIRGMELWFADTTLGASGLRAFDLRHDPPRELAGSPFAVGLPPMDLAPR